MDKKIQEIRIKAIKIMTERRHDTGWTHTDELLNDIFYVLGQIEIKDKALKEAETFVEELILAVDNCPPRLLDVEEIAQDGMVVINSIAASLKGEDTNE